MNPFDTFVLIGGGPSLTRADVLRAASLGRVIAINDAYKIAPFATCVFQRPMSSVYPSGAARATRPTPMLPFAPATFSMITG